MPNVDGVLEGEGRSCKGTVLTGTESEEMKIKAFEERALQDAARGTPQDDAHWQPQVSILRDCGFDKFSPLKDTYVGRLSGDVNGQVEAMLREVGVSNTPELVAQYFPEQGVNGHHSEDHDFAQYYRKQSVVDAVKKLYKVDYERLRHLFGSP